MTGRLSLTAIRKMKIKVTMSSQFTSIRLVKLVIIPSAGMDAGKKCTFI